MTGLERAYDNINKLVEFCNSKETNTTFGGSGKIIHLIKDTVGKATYIYGEYGYDKDFFVHLDKKFEVVAIAADNVVYIVDTYMFGEWEISRAAEAVVTSDKNGNKSLAYQSKGLPAGVRWFHDYYNELNEKLTNIKNQINEEKKEKFVCQICQKEYEKISDEVNNNIESDKQKDDMTRRKSSNFEIIDKNEIINKILEGDNLEDKNICLNCLKLLENFLYNF